MKNDKEKFKSNLKAKFPNHVAIILDGNRRWAKEKGLPIFEGHRRGLDAAIEIGKKAREFGIKILTLWVFSTENWDRSTEEKQYLWKLFEMGMEKHLKVALKEKIKIVHIGRKDRIPKKLKNKIEEVEEKTRKFSKYYLVIALDYGGRDEIIRAIGKLRENSKFQIPNSKFKKEDLENYLDTKDLPYPYPDLVIRTGREVRTSGFMVWQGAYSEYIFHPKYMPDFTPDDLEDCVQEYIKRQRRFGR